MSKLFSEQDKQGLVDFHFRSLQKMYFSEYIKKNEYVLLFSDLVEDSYYNYIGHCNRDINDVLNESREEFEKRNRQLAFYDAPGSSTYIDNFDIPNNFDSWAADAWMVLEDPAILTSYQISPEIIIESVGQSEKTQYANTFHIAYAGDNPDDPYANLPEYYSQSLKRSFDDTPDGFTKHYVWAKIGGTPAGVACMLSKGNISGIYGVGTIEEYRKKGVGKALMKHLVEKVTLTPDTKIMVQTEAGSKVEEWYKRMGFRTIFKATYYVEKTS